MSEFDDDRHELDAWNPSPPPANFADRVLAARRGEVAEVRGPRRRRAASFSVGLTIIAAIAAFLIFGRPGAAAGRLAATERTTATLGRRATVVAEAGARLDWSVGRDGAARVTQSEGEVFYRVEPGGSFVVQTPAGDVTVTGTCFRVEVMNMRPSKQALAGAAVGALVSAAILVSVYEGKVILANERGKTEVAAGERASAGSGGAPGPSVVIAKGGDPSARPVKKVVVAPEPPPADTTTRAELLARDRAQREELARLRGEVATLEKQLADGPRRGGLGGLDGDGSGSFMSPTKDELLDMAKNCEVRADSPPIGHEPFQIPARMASAVGVTPEEQARINQALVAMNDSVMAQMRALFVETTGNTAAAEELEPMAMEHEVQSKSSQTDVATAAKLISAERAGLQPPPADLRTRPPVERMMRLMGSVGDLAEQAIAGVIGPDRAHQMRALNDGWGQRWKMAGCNDDDAPKPGAPAAPAAPGAPAAPAAP